MCFPLCVHLMQSVMSLNQRMIFLPILPEAEPKGVVVCIARALHHLGKHKGVAGSTAVCMGSALHIAYSIYDAAIMGGHVPDAEPSAPIVSL